MGKGDGGKIAGWSKVGKDKWVHDNIDMKMQIGNKSRSGYPVALSGEDVSWKLSKRYTKFVYPKEKARKYAVQVMRNVG